MNASNEGGESKVAVLGLGSVGTFFSYILNKAGFRPFLIFRDLFSGGFTMPSIAVGESIHTIEGIPSTIDRIKDNSLDIVFLATKAYDAPLAIAAVRRKLSNSGVLIVAQNGLGTYELAQKLLGRKHVVSLVLNCGIYRLSRTKYSFSGCSVSYLGPSSLPSARSIGNILRTIPIKLVDDVQPYRWLKLCVNAGINPVTAVLRRKNGVILSLQEARLLASEAVEECVKVGSAEGVDFPSDPLEELFRVAEATKDNLSSMLQDILAGRRTEVDFINGVVAVRGLIRGLDVKTNLVLWRIVKAIEQGSSL